jgi:hypothetical protein
VIDSGPHEVRMAYHFGPLVQVALDGATASLAWPDAAVPGAAAIALPAGLEWRAYRGSADPVLGWYSEGLGRKSPAVTLVGTGRGRRDTPIITRIEFENPKLSNSAEKTAVPGETSYQPVRVSLGRSADNPGNEPKITAED